jgi:hypothetical protein
MAQNEVLVRYSAVNNQSPPPGTPPDDTFPSSIAMGERLGVMESDSKLS